MENVNHFLMHATPEKYLDPDGFRWFEQLEDYNYVQVHRLIEQNMETVYTNYMSSIWRNGGAKANLRVVIEKKGKGKGMVGCIRRLSGGIKEEITSAGVPRHSEEDQIASLSYTMIDGPFPVNELHVFVHFVPVLEDTAEYTLLIWECKYVSNTIGYTLCCGGVFIQLLLKYVYNLILQEFQEMEEGTKLT